MGSETQPLSDQAVEALKGGNMIAAIKLIRTERGVDLKEAKDIAEAYMRGNPAAADGRDRTDVSNPVMSEVPNLSVDAIVALRGGNKIEAIKLIRAGTRLGLKEAKDAAEAYIKANPELADIYARQGPPAGIAVVLVLAVIILGIIVFAAI